MEKDGEKEMSEHERIIDLAGKIADENLNEPAPLSTMADFAKEIVKMSRKLKALEIDFDLVLKERDRFRDANAKALDHNEKLSCELQSNAILIRDYKAKVVLLKLKLKKS